MQGSPEYARRDTKKNSTMNSAAGTNQGQKGKHLNQSNIVSRQKVQSFGSADKRQNQKHDLSMNSNKLMEGPHLQSLKLQQLNSNNLSMMSASQHHHQNASTDQQQEILNSSQQHARVLPGHVQATKSAKTGQKGTQNKSKERKNRVNNQHQQQPYIVQSSNIIPHQAYMQGAKFINMNPQHPQQTAAFMAIDGLNQSANNVELRKAAAAGGTAQQLTAFAHQLANNANNEQQLLFDDQNNQQVLSSAGGPDTIDLDVNLSKMMQSPEYSNDVNAKATGSRKRQIDAMNIKKTQSMKRMMLQKQDSSGVSPTSQAAIHMHNSIALLNQQNSGGRQSQLVNSANFIDQSIMHYYQTGHASSQPRGTKKTTQIKQQNQAGQPGHSKQLASANRAHAAAQRGNQSAKAGTVSIVNPHQQQQQQPSSVNQRKNRNLYTSIGQYNTNNASYKAAMGAGANASGVANNISNVSGSGMINEQSINANHSSLVALNQSLGHHYSNKLEASTKAMTNLSSHSGSRFSKRMQNNFMEGSSGHNNNDGTTGNILHQANNSTAGAGAGGGFQRMSTAAINSASAHRQGAKKPNTSSTENRKKVGSRNAGSKAAGNGASIMQSLINDESILSQQNTSKAINHSSLIVDSAEHKRLIGDTSLLSQERYAGQKKTRQQNAMSELRKSSKLPINQKKYAQDQLFGSLMRQASRQKGTQQQQKRVDSGRMSSLMRGEAARQSSQSLYNQRMKQQQQLIHQIDASLLKSSDQGNILINTADSLANNNQLIAALKMQSKQKGGGKNKQQSTSSQLNKSTQQHQSYQQKKAALNMKNQAALTSGYLSRDQTIDSNPLRSINKEVLFSEKKPSTGNTHQKDVINSVQQSHSNSAILRKNSAALRNVGPSPGYQILSDRDGVVLIQSNVQEEYASAPDLQRQMHQHQHQHQQQRIPTSHDNMLQSDRLNHSFDISIRDDNNNNSNNEVVRSCQVSQKWQEQIATKLAAQIQQRIDPLRLLQGSNNDSPLPNTSNSQEIDYEALFSFTSKSFEVFIETQASKQASCLNMIKNAYELLLKLSINQMVTQNESLRQQVKQLLLQKTPSSGRYTPKGQKKVKGERYSHDQAYLLQQINNDQKMNKVAANDSNNNNNFKSLKEQKDELSRKLDKANRDNILLMQIIQKNSNKNEQAVISEMIKTGINVDDHLSFDSASQHKAAMQASTAIVGAPDAVILVPQTKGIMPRLNKTTNPAKKQKQTSNSIGGSSQQTKKLSSTGKQQVVQAANESNRHQQNDNHHGPLHKDEKVQKSEQDQDRSPMMHPADSQSKPVIPLLNLDKVPPPKTTEENASIGKNAKLEDLIQVDTGKLVSPTPGDQGANNLNYDMSSYASSSCRYPADDIDDDVDDEDLHGRIIDDDPNDDQNILAGLPDDNNDIINKNMKVSMSSAAAGGGGDTQKDQNNRDDKLTQSQMLKRMLEAEAQDNQRDRQRDVDAESRDRMDRDRLNDARMMSNDTPDSRGRRERGEQLSETDDDGYVSSSVASSFDYCALTEEEKQRILGQAGAAGGGLGLNLAAVKQQKAEAGNTDFQDDFLAKYDEFSESWRQACDQMRKL